MKDVVPIKSAKMPFSSLKYVFNGKLRLASSYSSNRRKSLFNYATNSWVEDGGSQPTESEVEMLICYFMTGYETALKDSNIK